MYRITAIWSAHLHLPQVLEGGHIIQCSLGLSRKLRQHKSPLTQPLLNHFKSFELCVGMNGRVWVRADTTKHTVAISIYLKQCECMSVADAVMTLRQTVKALGWSCAQVIGRSIGLMNCYFVIVTVMQWKRRWCSEKEVEASVTWCYSLCFGVKWTENIYIFTSHDRFERWIFRCRRIADLFQSPDSRDSFLEFPVYFSRNTTC
jgi:uncharacterized membrane protein (DUF485 family)